MDARAYERQLRPLLGRAAGYARAVLRNRHDAEDAVQQAALRAWERINQYDSRRPFAGWWFAVLRNCCLDIRRSRREVPTDRFDDVAAGEWQPEAFDWQALETALASLSEAHREILRLRYYGDLSYAAMAETLGIPRGTVMSRLHAARKALAALIDREHA